MKLTPSKFVLHLREHQVYLWQDQEGNLVWPKANVTHPVHGGLELDSQGVRGGAYQSLGVRPAQSVTVPDQEYTSCVLIVSADVCEPLEPRAVHVYEAELRADP